MIKLELFKEKNLDLVCPNPFEFLTELLSLLGYSNKEYNLKTTREDVLETLKLLFELQVLDVHTWYAKPQLNNLDLSIIEKLNHINEIWFKGAKYPDFYNMMIFVSPDWYINQTKELGLTMTTNWKTFVKENIGDLEQWIEKNKPNE